MSDSLPHAQRLILASSSPYRRALLNRLGIAFDIIAPNIDETPLCDERPAMTVLRLATTKARTVATMVATSIPNALIIGSDQVANCDGQQLGKPGNYANALAQLKLMRARQVEFHNGLCVYDAQRDITQTANVVTYVRFRALPDHELETYLRLEKPYDVAGSAKSEGLGITLVESIHSDDPTALIGLPLITLTSMLRTAGWSLKALSAGEQGMLGNV